MWFLSMQTARQALICGLAVMLPMPLLAASDACAPRGQDVCVQAKQFAQGFAPQLPMPLNSNLTIQTVFADGPVIALTAQLKYGQDRLSEALESSGLTDQQMLAVMKRTAESSVCATGSASARFVMQGGQVRYVYQFNDGSRYTTVLIDRCAGG